jgi:hypothetical protein
VRERRGIKALDERFDFLAGRAVTAHNATG